MNSTLLQYMSKYQKKLDKLIELGKTITAEKIYVEREHLYAASVGVDLDLEEAYLNSLEPNQLSDAEQKILIWRTQCRHLLHQLPIQNTIYKELLELLEDNKKCERLKVIDMQTAIVKLESLLDDYQDGLLDSIILTIEGESSLNYLEQAKEFFDLEYYGAAALVAISALEGFLRSIYKSISKIDTDDNKESVSSQKDEKDRQTLEKLNNYLKNRNYIDKHTCSKIKDWTKVRNTLAHGDLKIPKDSARDLIMEIGNFISSRISHI